MSNPNLTTASGAIGLAKSLIDFVPASGTLINVSRETYDWLVRERIDEGSLESCRQMALGLAYPNNAGMDIQRQIKEADRKLVERVKQLPIRLVLSGSIGRLLAKNVDTCYMVSTVAALTKFHNLEFATDALCSMILDKGGHEKGVSFQYNVQRHPVKAVISKIVDSIYFNVVNAGHDLGGLPAELKHLHPHILDDRTFAGIVMGIERSEQDVVIRSDRFLSDLTLWLLLHFQGCIVVSVDKTVLFEKALGPRSRIVRIMVKELCPGDAHSCLMVPLTRVEALISVGDNLFAFLTGTMTNTFRPSPYARQAFYDVEHLSNALWSGQLEVLTQAECNSTANVANMIMDWLLNYLLFQSGEGEKSDMSIGDLLQNHPRLHTLETGLFPEPDPVVQRPDKRLPDAFFDDSFGDKSLHRLSSIITCVPMAQSLLEQVQVRCFCSPCKSEAKLDLCKRGCLRETAVTRIFVLLAHGICDAFGAKDISGCASLKDQVTGVGLLLSDILYEQLVQWDTWFELVACTTTGVSLDTVRSNGVRTGSSAWAAIQYGSLVAVAPWLDIAEKAKVQGCFGIIIIEGNLQGVPGDAGLVCCEEGNNQTQIETAGDDPNDNAFKMAVQLDTMKAEVYTAVFHTGGCFYRLMTTVRSDRNVRIVDPSQVIMGLARSHSIQCKHDPASAMNNSRAVKYVDDFDHILATWSLLNPYHVNDFSMSKVLDSQLKINVLLSICGENSVLRDTNNCCFNCAIGKLKGLNYVRQRCIINTTAHSSALTQTRARKGRMEL